MHHLSCQQSPAPPRGLVPLKIHALYWVSGCHFYIKLLVLLPYQQVDCGYWPRWGFFLSRFLSLGARKSLTPTWVFLFFNKCGYFCTVWPFIHTEQIFRSLRAERLGNSFQCEKKWVKIFAVGCIQETEGFWFVLFVWQDLFCATFLCASLSLKPRSVKWQTEPKQCYF